MFGERYFATREQLRDLMRDIAQLAVQAATDPGEHLPLAEIETGLGTPFLFVVCGEVNAGKSTLLNGLIGHDLCKVSVLPETDRVLWYRHGNPAHDLPSAPLLEQRIRPLAFLRDFNLVDTPGTNSAIQGHQEISACFLPDADLILFVFPISNPWGAATWDAISRLPADALDRMALIIQQADQRDANDIKVILGHMRDLSMKRLGRVPPIFAVSAKLACEAKRATPIAADLLAASGFPALEDFISNTICFSPARRLTLETWRDQAATALLAMEDLIATQSSTIQSQTLFIGQIEDEIDEIREQFVTRLPSHLASVAEVFERESVFVTRCLLSRLRSLPSLLRLFTGDQTGLAIEAVFIERLQSAVVDVAEQDGGKVADACHSHWQNLAQRVKSVLGVDLITANPIDETVANARKRFVRDLGHAAREGIGNLQVRNPLDKELRNRNDALKSFVFMTLVLTNIGAICGALNVPWLPGILCGLAALFLAGGVMTAWATQTSIARDFQRRLLDTCGAFASTLHSDYAEALRVVFQDYASSLNNVHTHLDHENHAIEPRRLLRQQLYLTLKAIEQDL